MNFIKGSVTLKNHYIFLLHSAQHISRLNKICFGVTDHFYVVQSERFEMKNTNTLQYFIVTQYYIVTDGPQNL